jgi:hypothetical protein
VTAHQPVLIEVAIASHGDGSQIRVEVLDSPAGNASATVTLDKEGLLAKRSELEIAVMASAALNLGARRLSPRVKLVGESLFTALFGSPATAGAYRSAETVAARAVSRLRVVLRLGEPGLAALPWETMFDGETGAYLCRRNELVRYLPVGVPAMPLAVKPPLQILAIASSPSNHPRLDVGAEKARLASALDDATRAGRAQITWTDSATWNDLQQVLSSQQWHVVHYVGHGGFDSQADEGLIVLTNSDGEPQLVEASKLVDLFRQVEPALRLVVLNSCSGATAGTADLFSATAAALVRGGVGAAVAMQYAISDRAATAFAGGFYGAIAAGRGVDQAVSSGRVAILGLESLEWVTPAAFLRSQDSQLLAEPTVSNRPTDRRAWIAAVMSFDDMQDPDFRRQVLRIMGELLQLGKAFQTSYRAMPIDHVTEIINRCWSYDPSEAALNALADALTWLRPDDQAATNIAALKGNSR